MKKLLLIGLTAAICFAFIAGCGRGASNQVPTKTGGGGKQQPYIPAAKAAAVVICM